MNKLQELLRWIIEAIGEDATEEYKIKNEKNIITINYIEWLNKAEQLAYKLEDDELKQLIKQISWISNLTNTDEAQEIFDIWYNEMITDTQYETLIQIGEGE